MNIVMILQVSQELWISLLLDSQDGLCSTELTSELEKTKVNFMSRIYVWFYWSYMTSSLYELDKNSEEEKLIA
jgi:hypothetical protein